MHHWGSHSYTRLHTHTQQEVEENLHQNIFLSRHGMILWARDSYWNVAVTHIRLHYISIFKGEPGLSGVGCRYSSTHSVPSVPAGIREGLQLSCWRRRSKRRRRRRRRWESWKWFPKCGWEGVFNPICASKVLVSNQSGGVAQSPRLWKRSPKKGSIIPGPNYTLLSQHTYIQTNLAFTSLSPNHITPPT